MGATLAVPGIAKCCRSTECCRSTACSDNFPQWDGDDSLEGLAANVATSSIFGNNDEAPCALTKPSREPSGDSRPCERSQSRSSNLAEQWNLADGSAAYDTCEILSEAERTWRGGVTLRLVSRAASLEDAVHVSSLRTPMVTPVPSPTAGSVKCDEHPMGVSPAPAMSISGDNGEERGGALDAHGGCLAGPGAGRALQASCEISPASCPKSSRPRASKAPLTPKPPSQVVRGVAPQQLLAPTAKQCEVPLSKSRWNDDAGLRGRRRMRAQGGA